MAYLYEIDISASLGHTMSNPQLEALEEVALLSIHPIVDDGHLLDPNPNPRSVAKRMTRGR